METSPESKSRKSTTFNGISITLDEPDPKKAMKILERIMQASGVEFWWDSGTYVGEDGEDHDTAEIIDGHG
jgi:hypothetical protein